MKYNVYCFCLFTQPYPNEVPAFQSSVTELYESSVRVALKILEVMGHALKLSVGDFTVKDCWILSSLLISCCLIIGHNYFRRILSFL